MGCIRLEFRRGSGWGYALGSQRGYLDDINSLEMEGEHLLCERSGEEKRHEACTLGAMD